MAQHTYVTLHCKDGKNKPTRFSYESLADIPDDGDVQDLIDAFKAMSRLGIEAVTISYHLDGFVPIPADDIDARIGDTAILTCHKGAEFGGTYSFKLAAIHDDLVDNNGNLKVEESAFTDWCELFDDGSGLLGVQGAFTISDGEQLAENNSDPTLPSGFTPISGKLTGKRR